MSLQEKSAVPSQSSHNLDGAPIGDKDNKKSRNSNKEISQESDSFNKHYNKEIKVNQEEIPIVLYELLDAAYNYIQRESYEKAIILLQKTEGVLDVVPLEQSKRDRLGMLEECYVYLKECLKMISVQQFYKENTVAARMRQIRQECKLKLQLCAILSQTQNHTEALDNAKKSVKLIHQLFKDLLTLCSAFIKKIENRDPKLKKILNNFNKNEDQPSERQQVSILSTSPSQFQGGGQQIQSNGNFLEDSISMLERTSLKLYPIVKEVVNKMIEELPHINQNNEKLASEIEYEKILLPEDADMRSVLGFLNQNEWIYNLNIGNIMQIHPISMKELLSSTRNEAELSRDSFLEKLSLLSVAYFCVSTEMRFILQSRVEFLTSPVKKKKELESEFWHAKALEIACTFLPSECPLLNHILLSYQKHHDPSQQPINEDQEQNDILDVIRPLKGIESNKYQPIIRQIQNLKVAISPCQMSPLTRRIFKNYPFQTTDKKSLPQSATNQQVQQKTTDQIDIQGLINASAINESKETGNSPSIHNKSDLKIDKSQGQESRISRQSIQELQANLYSDEYYEVMVKKIFDDPNIDKKQLVTRLLSKIKSEDFNSLQQIINNQENDQVIFDDQEANMSKSFEVIHTLQSQKEIENPDESSLHQIWTDSQNQRKSVQSNQSRKPQLTNDTKLKKRKDPRIQKIMSYLEGDSLLREIEKSLEREELEFQDDEQEDDEDQEIENASFDPDQLSPSIRNEEINQSQLIADISNDAILQNDRLSNVTKLANKSVKESGEQSSNLKSKSYTRPSSSFTNHTTNSQLRKVKKNNQKKLQAVNNHQFQSQHQNYQRKSITSSSDRSHSSDKLFSHPIINNFVSNKPDKQLQAQVMAKNEAIIKKNAKISKSKQLQTKKERSGSRLSNPGLQKSSNNANQSMNTNKRLSILFNTKEKKSGYKRGRKSRSSSNDNASKSEGRRKVSRSKDKSHDISIFNKICKDTPLLTQPSENLIHNYSFDIALPSSQKNINKTTQGENYSLTELQKRVLENQKLLMMFKHNNSDTKKTQKKRKSYGNLRQNDLLSQLSQFNNINNQSITEPSQHRNSSQSRSKSNNFGSKQVGTSLNLLNKQQQQQLHNQHHQQSIDNHHHSLQHHNNTRQSKNGTSAALGLAKNDIIGSILENNNTLIKKTIQVGNKENINSSILMGQSKQQQLGVTTKKSKKKSSQQHNAINQTFIAEKNKLTKELEYIKSRMKEHFRFFDNHSPKLKKRQAGSHSPPKKHTQSHNRSFKADKSSKQQKLQQQIFATTDNRRQISKKRISNIGASDNHHNLTTHNNNDCLNDDSLWLPHEQSFDNFVKQSISGGGGQKIHNISNVTNLQQDFPTAFENNNNHNSSSMFNGGQIQSQDDLRRQSLTGATNNNQQQQTNQQLQQQQQHKGLQLNRLHSQQESDKQQYDRDSLLKMFSGIHRGSTDVMILNSGSLQKVGQKGKRGLNDNSIFQQPSKQLVSQDITNSMPFELASSSLNSKIVPLRNRNASKVLKGQLSGKQPLNKSSGSLAPHRQSFDQINRKVNHLRA